MKYRIDTLADLARQLAFTPQDARAHQLRAAEELLHSIDPAKAYPLEFVIFRITGYHRKTVDANLLAGIALQHDLGLLIEQVSDTLDLRVGQMREPVLAIDDVTERFNVTSKTIQRWRRKGLPARRFVFPDGKRRVGFLLGSVERFFAGHHEQVERGMNFSPMSEDECDRIIRNARRLAHSGCWVDEIARRIARKFNRSPLTILHTLKKHDQDHPERAVLPLAAEPMSEDERARVAKNWRRGRSLSEIAHRLGRARSAVYRVVLDERIARLARRKVNFTDDPLYHQEDAQDAIETIVSQEELVASAARSAEELRVPRDLPLYLQSLYRVPLLTPNRERALFLKFNFHKYRFVAARRKLEPQFARSRDLTALEQHLADATEVKNQITQANLRLVVSVARKHLRPGLGEASAALMEMISDGNIILMRAIEGFDLHRGNRFSTYATLALMKGFARSVPQMMSRTKRAAGGDSAAEMLEAVPDRHSDSIADRFIDREQVRHLLTRLTDRERSVLQAHYGLGGRGEQQTYEELGERMGLSKQRIRQIEQTAIAKLRSAAGITPTV